VLAEYLIDAYRVSARRACRVVMLARSTFNYTPRPRNDDALARRIREIALTRVRYGYWRIYTLLRREGLRVNHKRARRNRAAAHRLQRMEETRPHQV
jgi:putative transposase